MRPAAATELPLSPVMLAQLAVLQVTTLLNLAGVAQWLGLRSLAGGLSLISAWSMVDM